MLLLTLNCSRLQCKQFSSYVYGDLLIQSLNCVCLRHTLNMHQSRLNFTLSLTLNKVMGLTDVHCNRTGTNFMALLTVSKESALTENRDFRAYVKHITRLAGNFCLCVWLLHFTRHSSRTHLAQKFGACAVSGEW